MEIISHGKMQLVTLSNPSTIVFERYCAGWLCLAREKANNFSKGGVGGRTFFPPVLAPSQSDNRLMVDLSRDELAILTLARVPT